MAGTLITITDAGRAALVAPDNTGTAAHKVVKVGLASAPFVADPTLKALPNERKRITTFGGANVDPHTVHLTLKDDSDDQFTLYGLGLYLENDLLFAVYSQATPIMEKAPAAMLLLSADILFATIDAATLTFGDATFLNPPATTEAPGVVELATAAETITGTDTQRAVTPSGLKSAVAVAIANKSEIGHHHLIIDIDGLQSALDAKSPVGHVHTIANVTGLQSALDSKLGLAGGELSGGLRLKTTGTYSAPLYLDANGYAPFLRANGSSRQLEFVDSANQNLNATLSDGGVLSLPRARPTWAGLVPWDSGNLPNPLTTNGGTLANNAALVTRPTYGKTAFQVAAADSVGIGGPSAQWNGDRTPALQIDSPSATSAYMGMRWTRWDGRHLAAIEAYEGGSTTSQPTLAFQLANQNNAWTFDNGNISRGAGGYVWGSWNLNPANYVSKGGDTMTAPLTTQDRGDYNGYSTTMGGGYLKLAQYEYGAYVDFARVRTDDFAWRIHYNFNANELEFIRNGWGNVRFTGDGSITTSGGARYGTDGNVYMPWRGQYISDAFGHFDDAWNKANDAEVNRADRGAQVQWNSGVAEFGDMTAPTPDNCPAPWVVVGARVDQVNGVWNHMHFRCVCLRNN